MAEYKIKNARTADIDEIFFDKNTNKLSYKNKYGLVTVIATEPLPTYNGIFVQTGDSIPIEATTTEGSLLDGGIGSLAVPSNAFKVGDSFRLMMGGAVGCASGQNLTLKIKSGSTILATSGAISMSPSTDKHWFLIVDFTVRAIGSAGTAEICSFCQFTYNKNSSNDLDGQIFHDDNNTTFDTTLNNILDITAQWSSTNGNNIIYSKTCTLIRVF